VNWLVPEAERVPDAGRAPSRRARLRVVVAVGLLALLATAVALVLAQSAGAIHLGFLGPVA
jgi:hypothetical protein